MATKALDIVTIMYALKQLTEAKNWNPINKQQKQLLEWMKTYEKALGDIKDIKAKISHIYQELNRFLEQNDFDPMVEPFDPNQSVGVVTILDKLVNWKQGPAKIVKIHTKQGPYPGFELPENGVNIFEVEGYEGSFLIEILTTSKDTLWLFSHNEKNLKELDIVKLSMDVMGRSRRISMIPKIVEEGEIPAYTEAHIPMVDFNIKPDIKWLEGAYTRGYGIQQAAQQFKFRMDEKGARVKTATVIVAKRSITVEPEIFKLNQPFYGWWTQEGIDLPMATFFADWDSFRKTHESLENM